MYVLVITDIMVTSVTLKFLNIGACMFVMTTLSTSVTLKSLNLRVCMLVMTNMAT